MDVDDKFVVYSDTKGNVRIKLKDNGAVPSYLDGIFTSVREAVKAISVYEDIIGSKKPLKDKSAKLESLG